MPIDMNTVSGSYVFDNYQLNSELIILLIALVYYLKKHNKTLILHLILCRLLHANRCHARTK